MPLKVCMYSRVSTEEEKQVNALKIQIEENEEFIKKQDNWVLVQSYIDEGKSATTTKGRDEFKRLLADMLTPKFDIILIKIIDRGWRNTLDWKMFEKLLIETKKKLFIRSRNAFYDFNNPTDYMATGFEAQFAEWSSLNQSIKMNNAHQTRMKKGTVVTNGRLWGYNQVDGNLEINEEQAKVVRYVFNAYIQRKGFRTIVKELDSMGITNLNGNTFSLTTLKRMIRQTKYKGTLVCGKNHKNYWTKELEAIPEDQWIVHENAVPAIVTPETWDRANEVLAGKRQEYGLEEKRKIAGYFSGTHLYSGKIICGICGRPYYHSIYTTGKNRDIKTKFWECKGYREFGKSPEINDKTGKPKGCNNTRIQEHEMDEMVKQVIFEFLENKDEVIQKVINELSNKLSKNQYNSYP